MTLERRVFAWCHDPPFLITHGQNDSAVSVAEVGSFNVPVKTAIVRQRKRARAGDRRFEISTHDQGVCSISRMVGN